LMKGEKLTRPEPTAPPNLDEATIPVLAFRYMIAESAIWTQNNCWPAVKIW
jgi:hypothetical protein